MSMSLRDQLIQAGLVNEKQAKQATQQESQQMRLRQHHQSKNKPAPLPEHLLAVQQAQVAKAARDQELNRKQQDKAQRKARSAQIKQLIEQSRVPKIEGDDYYNFIDDKKVKRIAVNALMREQLHRGELVIVRCDGRYEVVPATAAARIGERDAAAVIARVVAPAAGAQDHEQDNGYQQYTVPDDLMW